MFNESMKKMGELAAKWGLTNRLEDKLSKNKITGEFFVELRHNDGKIEKWHHKNVIVDSASLLIARLLADGQTSVDPSGPTYGLRVLAVGTGDPGWDPNNPPPPTSAQTTLESELARKRYANVTFIKTDGSGLPATVVTNIVDYQTVYNESEAVGPIIELGLFGGGYPGEDVDNTPDSGTMLNYRTVPVINKTNTSTLSIVFRITT